MESVNLLGELESCVQQYSADKDIIKLYQTVSECLAKRLDFSYESQTGKYAHYLSMEFLIGRMIDNNLLNLGLLAHFHEILSRYGVEQNCFETISDYAFGNGGLGRLASCFLDSGASLGLKLNGYGMRYRYGLFKQSIQDGGQVEQKEDWLKFGDPWSIRRENERELIEFADKRVYAVPYDMCVVGYQSDTVNILRLWQSEGVNGDSDGGLCDYLYPDDRDDWGKILRIRQEYFLASSSMRCILKRFVAQHGLNFDQFPNFNVIQLNDTHPVLAILDCIYLLTKVYKVRFSQAFETARKCFNYTNHTIMNEALEKWNVKLVKKILPEHVKIAKRLQRIMCQELKRLGATQMTAKQDSTLDSRQDTDSALEKFKLIANKQIHMANIALFMCASVNGVAKIHTEILKNELFRHWHAMYPYKIQNKTNGITPRRWLKLANSELSTLIESKIGEHYLKNLSELAFLQSHMDDNFIQAFMSVKRLKKEQLKEFVARRQGENIRTEFMFDMQIKRFHEYKRQLLNCFSILYIYHELKAGRLPDFHPTLFIFAGKAAASYKRAKSVIRFIVDIAKLIASDKDMENRLQVVFIADYNVSVAEKLFPAADVSEQISLAGTEASGTGNMKFMLNGTVTLGTYDGANVEIVEESGFENNYIFGMLVDEVKSLQPHYNPLQLLEHNPKLKMVVQTLIDGTFQDDDGGYRELYDSLTIGASWHKPDHYFVLQDFESYIFAKLRANQDYQNKVVFAKKCVQNMIHAGKFSSDRTIQEYARDIWKL